MEYNQGIAYAWDNQTGFTEKIEEIGHKRCEQWFPVVRNFVRSGVFIEITMVLGILHKNGANRSSQGVKIGRLDYIDC